MTSARVERDEDERLGRAHVLALDAAVTRALPTLRERATLLEVIANGYRRPDLVDALEALACDQTMPSGAVSGWARDDAPATRELALFVRAQLGVEPAHVARVRMLAQSVADPIARDLILAYVEDDANAVTLRLLAHLSGTSQAPVWAPIHLILRATATMTSRRASARTRYALAKLLTERPVGSSLTKRPLPAVPGWPGTAFWRAYQLLPGAGVEEHDPRRREASKPPRRSLANVAPRSQAPTTWEVPENVGRDEPAYRALRAGAAYVDAELLASLPIGLEATLTALDALADADALSVAGVEHALELASPSVRFGHDDPIVDAALRVLGRHAPERGLELLRGLASSASPRTRARAATALGHVLWAGTAGMDLLRALESDTTYLVRRAAHAARARRAELHDARLWRRRVLWTVLRDDAAAAMVFEHLAAERPVTTGLSEERRLRRVFGGMRHALSQTARDRLDWALAARLCVPRVGRADVRKAELRATDGRSLAVALIWESGDRPTEVLATIVEGDEPSLAFLGEVDRFVATASSQFMRIMDDHGRVHAVRVRARQRPIVLTAADPRVLEHIR